MRGLAAALLALCALTGCKAGEPWTFALSRDVYGSDLGESLEESDPVQACVLAVVLALPLAADLVLLPVALPRDLMVHGAP